MIKAKKVLGQNFLVDKNKVNKIIDSIPELETSTIVEVGPGTGALTVPLSERAKKLISIELDTDMIQILEDKIKSDNFTLLNNDILDVDFNDILGDIKHVQFVSNLPYYISTKIMFKVAYDLRFDSMSVMLQKELVNRIFAKKNTKEYGRLTVSIGSLFELVTKIDVPATCFKPKPNVDSGFIVLKRKDTNISNIDDYLSFIKASFANKRKTLINSLKNSNFNRLESVQKYLIDHNIKENIRSEEISIDTFIDIYQNI
ncbi:MAG: 16S rRNA (adenine(1518)-N(6)/adenine(1519)-N(6))-dimethyltransferase RsmA [Pikeienuella sp.]